METIMIVGPFDTNGRYKGGVHTVCNLMCRVLSEHSSFDLIKINTCPLNRKSSSKGRVSISNILNYFVTKKDIKKKSKAPSIKACFIHSSRGRGLLKDLMLLRSCKNAHKRIIQIHNCDIDSVLLSSNKHLMKKIICYLNNIPTDIVVLSKTLKFSLQKCGITTPIHVLYNFADGESCHKKTDDAFKTPINVMYMASIEKNKGIYDLINAFEMIDNDYVLNIYGNPISDEDSHLIEQINKSNIKYHGYVTNKEKEEAFENSSVFVIPSYSEGAPITLLEAMNHGMLIISTNVGSIKEIVGEKNFHEIQISNPQSIIDAFNNLSKKKIIDLKAESEENIKRGKAFNSYNYHHELIKILGE